MKRITFFVGPNGCGKTRQLGKAAQAEIRRAIATAAIANTPFVRFPRSRRGFDVFRVSPAGITKVVSKNLERFFDDEGRDTFDISDLLQLIGFDPSVELQIKMDNHRSVDLLEITSNKSEIDALSAALDVLKSKGEGSFLLSGTSDSFLRSFREQNRIIFKYIHTLRSADIISSYSLVFRHHDRGQQRFSELSSGEQTLISTYLFIRSNLADLRTVFIDEPENSLHPEWQRRYLEILHMALGYHDVRLVLATHSPVLVSGALSSYEKDVDVVRIDGNQRHNIDISNKGGSESVEKILWHAFNTITPVSHYLSVELSTILQQVTDGLLTRDSAELKIQEFQNQSYDQQQKKVLNQ